jgi:uncharacterized protein YndB with AHSA1/START domain
MTQQKTFKRRVRSRMEKTGESYTAARRQLIAEAAEPAPALEPTVAEERVIEATGHGWNHWLATLDDWGATGRSHRDIARWLREEHGVAGWYSQAIAVTYERARGMRAVGEGVNGFTVSATRTVYVPAGHLFAAFDDPELRERWLPGVELSPRTSTPPRLARYDWEGGPSRLVVGIEALEEGKSRVGMAHEKLADLEERDRMKVWWRDRLGALKQMLEEG